MKGQDHDGKVQAESRREKEHTILLTELGLLQASGQTAC